MDAKRKVYTETTYREHLNDVYGDVCVCGINMQAGDLLAEVDPIAFRRRLADQETELWECGQCGDEFATEAEAEDCCPEEDE